MQHTILSRAILLLQLSIFSAAGLATESPTDEAAAPPVAEQPPLESKEESSDVPGAPASEPVPANEPDVAPTEERSSAPVTAAPVTPGTAIPEPPAAQQDDEPETAGSTMDTAPQQTTDLPEVTRADASIAPLAPASEAGDLRTDDDPDPASTDAGEPAPEDDALSEAGAEESASVATEIHDTPGDQPAEPTPDTLTMLGTEVPRGTSTRLAWTPSESFSGIAVPTPVLVVNGASPGPTLCLTAAVHGDELTGIEVVRRVMFGLNPQKLNGTVIGVPIVNLQGFRRNSRYLPDRRDLNRYFPGNVDGSLAERVAHSFFHEVVTHCNALVDLHTGSFHRTNLPQVRADMNVPGVAELARNMGDIMVLQSSGNLGTLRRAAVEHGIPAVTLEAGEPMRLAEAEVAHGVKSIQSLLSGMEMHGTRSRWGQREPVYYKSFWVRANTGGILFSRVKLGDRIKTDQLLGTVTDPITNARAELRAPRDGRVIGMALNQVVMPGFAAYHVGIQTTEEHAAEPVIGLEVNEGEGAAEQTESAADTAADVAPASAAATEYDDQLEDS